MNSRPQSFHSDFARPKCVLIIAGLDPSAGAGLLADAAIVRTHGLHPLAVATGLTVQNSIECSRMYPVSPAILSEQIESLIADFNIRAVKIGMLATHAIANLIAAALTPLRERRIPIVLDPVMQATHGADLLLGSAQNSASILSNLLKVVTVVTPNLRELSWLTGLEITDVETMALAARALKNAGCQAILAKGGHLAGDPVDILVDEFGESRWSDRRTPGPSPHGTGCALSSELACFLALECSLCEATRQACERVRQRLGHARAIGQGRPFLF